MGKPVRPLDHHKVLGLIEVSKGTRAASVWIRDGSVLNVYTGELEKADIVLFEDRIAYVGMKSPMCNESTLMLDAKGFTLVPGYIEPHAHPFQIYNIKTLSEFALSTGTTTMVNDNLLFYLNMGVQDVEHLMEYSNSLPVKNYWWTRLDPQSNQPDMLTKFTTERLVRLLRNEAVIQAGELTSWPSLLAGDKVMVEGIVEARRQGKRIEGHNPGASADTLNMMASLGVTACHESISGEEVLRRLRLGMYATMRHSSIRPDLPDLIKGLKELDFDFSSAASSRLMMTTDGSMPFFHQYGFVDFMIKLALKNGVPAASAYRMATLNPAVYYGLDQEIGGIAPGRIADILFLEDIESPTPVQVMTNGQLVAQSGKLTVNFPEYDWERHGFKPLKLSWRMKPEWLDMESNESKIPTLNMLNAVILKLEYEEFALKNGKTELEGRDGYCYAGLVDQKGEWITNAILKGFADRLDALATSYTASQDILVIGQDKSRMAQAVNKILENGGGTILMEGEETIFYLPLPLGGRMSMMGMEELIEKTGHLKELLHKKGYKHHDPLYTMFFLTATHLPAARLTAAGLYSVKENRSLYPAKLI